MIEKIIKIFVWLRDKNSPDLDMIRVYKVEGDIITSQHTGIMMTTRTVGIPSIRQK